MTGDEQAQNMPAADVAVDEALVRRVLEHAAAHDGLDPELASQDLQLLANGWDNTLYRLGDHHVVRLPRRAVAIGLVLSEQRWLPQLAPHLPIPVPVPIFAGLPSPLFDRPWSIVPWFDGEPLGERSIADEPAVVGDRLALDLADFLHHLHQPAPADAPLNPFRGVPLTSRAERTVSHLSPGSVAMTAIGSDQAAGRLRAVWGRALDQPRWSGGDRWLHGDLHPLNLLWHDDRLAAVIDFGDICGGDPATDLAVAWSVFADPVHRRHFQSLARIDNEPVDVATWHRAAGWALSVACAIAANSADHPVLDRLSRRTLLALAGWDHDETGQHG
ncbi:MAG: aminoglycoside phosphotransferase family protein [Acidimicrobiia bacterium]|nr:aminoglycoside phosphotransferase family protein [Acidimicrobiia bacterium]MDH5519653.1 aminoglycoside phosphotransferase family protein [Acidimicrobiia bacterium]